VDDDGVAGERIDLRLMTNRDEVSAALRRMLADKLQIRLDKITEANSLNIDLGMDGDDAVEFFEELGERFQLSMEALSEEWERYFAREGVAFFGTDGVLTLFTARACRKRVEPMLLSRVIDAVLDGHWTSTKEVT
jgi:acyl carrier protein